MQKYMYLYVEHLLHGVLVQDFKHYPFLLCGKSDHGLLLHKTLLCITMTTELIGLTLNGCLTLRYKVRTLASQRLFITWPSALLYFLQEAAVTRQPEVRDETQGVGWTLVVYEALGCFVRYDQKYPFCSSSFTLSCFEKNSWNEFSLSQNIYH